MRTVFSSNPVGAQANASCATFDCELRNPKVSWMPPDVSFVTYDSELGDANVPGKKRD
jgi:hypothetical protein